MRTAVSTLLTFCPPLPPARIVVDLEVLVLHLDVNLVLDVGRDLDCGERRLPAGVRVERRDAHEAVHAVLAPQVAERVIPLRR